MKTKRIMLTDTIGGTVTIKNVRPLCWQIRQRVLKGDDQDNTQNPTWIKIDNPGPKTKIEISLLWAYQGYQHYRRSGYQKVGAKYTLLRGRIGITNTVYNFEIPGGTSYFGSYPWHFNEDTERFLSGISARHSDCRVRIIGKTAQGREIKCLTIGREEKWRKKQNVVVLARLHAMEIPGSLAVEGTAKYLLNSSEAKKLLKKYVFHLFPNVNPDGTAAGLKLTRIGPNKIYNMDTARSEKDLSVRSLRAEIRSLKPACIIDHHSYLSPIPMFIFFDKRVGAVLFDELFDEKGNDHFDVLYWRFPFPWFIIKEYCYKKFKSTIVATELPWNFDRLPPDIEKLGVKVFLATIKAHEKKMLLDRKANGK